MSTTQSVADVDVQADTQSRGQRALRFFDELLFENPEVCSHCFSRIRDRTEHDTEFLGTGNRPTETLERAGKGVVGHDERQLDDYGAITTPFARTYCGECGSPGGTDDPKRIRSLQQVRGHGDAILRRLHEAGYYPDVQTFYTALERLKQNPDRQGQDREILAAASFLAVERGRERSGVNGLERADAMPPIPRRITL